MSLSIEKKEYLEKVCKQCRIDIIETLHNIQTGHPGGSLSAVEIIITLYFEKINIKPNQPKWPNRDRFILGKGHAAPALYWALAEKGYFPKEDFKSLRQLGCHLQGHPCADMTKGVELSTGPLGLGLPAGIGMALASKLDNIDNYTYVLIGDGEIQEGIIWEAAMSASKFKVDNLIAILDNNGVQLDGTVAEIMPMGDIAAKWRAFGWNVIDADGHSIESISDAIDEAKIIKGMPTIIIAKTIKGKGVSFIEGNVDWHNLSPTEEQIKLIREELK